MKKLLLLLVTIFIIVNPYTVNAMSVERQYVYDNADLLTADQEADLQTMCVEYREKGKVDIVLVTINEPSYYDCDQYLENMYDEYKFGYNQEFGDTVMMIVDIKTREVSLQGYGKAEFYMSNERGDVIREKLTPDLTAARYFDAFEIFIMKSSSYMHIPTWINPDWIIFNTLFQLIFPLIVGLIAVFLMAFYSGGRVTVNERTYMNNDTSRLVRKDDTFIREHTTKVRKQSSSGSGGRSSGGHSHSSSRGGF